MGADGGARDNRRGARPRQALSDRRPVALKLVWDAARALKIPVIGMGGICTADDAVQFLLAGARAVAIGSYSFRKPDAALRVVEGLEDYCTRHDVDDINQLVGAMEV